MANGVLVASASGEMSGAVTPTAARADAFCFFGGGGAAGGGACCALASAAFAEAVAAREVGGEVAAALGLRGGLVLRASSASSACRA